MFRYTTDNEFLPRHIEVNHEVGGDEMSLHMTRTDRRGESHAVTATIPVAVMREMAQYILDNTPVPEEV